MPGAYGFPLSGAQGVIFALSDKARRDRTQQFGEWTVEVRKDIAFICANTDQPHNDAPLPEQVADAHDATEQLLDMIAVEERTALLSVEPHNNVAWRTGAHGLKVVLTAAITFSAEFFSPTITLTDTEGNVVPNPPYVPPPVHASYRYFRYSQSSQNIFEAYKNMFLAFESLLDHLAPKQQNEGETDWLERALTTATTSKGLDLSAFAKPRNKPVEDFLDTHYSTVRCAIFHSKSSFGQSLRPGSLKDYDTVLHQLLAVQGLVEHLMKKEFGVRLPTSGFYHKGFGHLLEQLSPAMAFLISEGTCPTVQQFKDADESAEVDAGMSQVTTFAGSHMGLSDEWLFYSEFRAQGMPITTVRSVRLVARPNEHMLLGPIADRINDTLITTDLDLAGVSKLRVDIRCILRNRHAQKRGFSH